MPGRSSPVRDMIETRDVSLSFSHPILDQVSLRIADESVTVVMGRSGVGKSVLLRVITGIYPPDEGDVIIDGTSLYSRRAPRRMELLSRIGMVSQEGGLFDDLTVQENIAFPVLKSAHERGESQRRAEARSLNQVLAMADTSGLTEHLEKYPAQLSGGLRRKVALARALVREPRYIFFDEPTAGLDPISSATIEQMILDTVRVHGVTSLVVTHDVELAITVGDSISLLDSGRIRYTETGEELRSADSNIRREFFEARQRMRSQQ